MCSFVLAAVKQSGGDWEILRPLAIAALSSSRAENGKQSESRTVTLLNKTEAGYSDRARMYEEFFQISV